jgi:hypothetical protein
MDSKQPVNFYFGNLEKSGLVSTTDSTDKTSTSYIILQNDHLHGRVKELETEVHELTDRVNELEEDNESLETSKTSLKGYVQNQGEYNRLSKNLVEIYDTAIGGLNKQKEELEWNIKFLGSAFLVLEVCLFLYKLYSIDVFGVIEMLILNGLASYIAMKMYKPYCELVKIRNIKNVQSVIKIREGLKEASKGNDYLTELIDRL